MKLAIAVLCLAALISSARGDNAPKVQIGPGGQLIVGGFDPDSFEHAAKSAAALEAAIPKLKSLGVTSNEVYVRWNLCEVAPGKWDWSVYDRYVALYKKNNLKWVPFLICGSPYSLPDWYYKKPGSQGYVCLEHGEETDVQSLWNPEMRRHVSEFIKAFCDHYRDTGTIEAMLLGVSGNYGEAIYPVTGNDWTADRHGKYHTHPGFWAGDPFAVKDFAAAIKKKYGTTEKLKLAWGDKAPDIDAIKPFLPKDAPNDRAWFDFVDWYQQSMTDYAKFWLTETRKNLPDGGIYLCTGGHAPPMHGSDFGEQCKMAAEVGAGVRITNEGSDYALNFALTRWVASAGEQYGAYFSFEPAGGVDANGVVARIYNATASGAKGLHYYYPNLFDKPAATANFIRMGAEFQQRKPLVEIAVYYPTTQFKLEEKADSAIYGLFHRCKPLRDRFDFNFISDAMIRDGGLDRYKALILLQGQTFEPEVIERIATWQSKGGTLVLPANIAQNVNVLGGPEATAKIRHDWQQQAGPEVPPKPADVGPFCDYVTDKLAKSKSLSPLTLAMLKSDGKADGVFVTALESGELLWFNSTDHEVITTTGLMLPAVSIEAEKSEVKR